MATKNRNIFLTELYYVYFINEKAKKRKNEKKANTATYVWHWKTYTKVTLLVPQTQTVLTQFSHKNAQINYNWQRCIMATSTRNTHENCKIVLCSVFFFLLLLTFITITINFNPINLAGEMKRIKIHYLSGLLCVLARALKRFRNQIKWRVKYRARTELELEL